MLSVAAPLFLLDVCFFVPEIVSDILSSQKFHCVCSLSKMKLKLISYRGGYGSIVAIISSSIISTLSNFHTYIYDKF